MHQSEKWDTPEQEACKAAQEVVREKEEKLFYALEGRRAALTAGNRRDANNWIRHIDQAYLDYSDAMDEWDATRRSLKLSRLAMLQRIKDRK